MISPRKLTLLFCAVFLACKTSTKEENFHPSQCRIVAIQDSSILEYDKTVQFNFICTNNTIVKQFNLLNENPWKNLDFPILTKSSRMLIASPTHEWLKKGSLNFNFNNSPIEQVAGRLPMTIHDHSLGYYATTAGAICTYENYSPHYLLVSYWFNLMGCERYNFKNGSKGISICCRS